MDESLHPRLYCGSLLGRPDCVFHSPNLRPSQYIDDRRSENLAQDMFDKVHFQMTLATSESNNVQTVL
jgi:hypothetical protein